MIVWNERNTLKNIQTTMIELLEKLKYNSFWWLKASNVNFVYGTNIWWSDPLLCLGIDRPLLCNYIVTVCFWGGLFSTPCALEEPSPVLIYSIFLFLKKCKRIFFWYKITSIYESYFLSLYKIFCYKSHKHVNICYKDNKNDIILTTCQKIKKG